MTYLSLESPIAPRTVMMVLSIAALAWVVIRLWLGPPAGLSRRIEFYVLRGLVLATLGAICLNPVQVTESPGLVERPEVFYLVDSSQSMALGDPTTRFDEALATMRAAARQAKESPVDVKLFRFGQRLQAGDDSGLEVTPLSVAASAGTGLNLALSPPLFAADSPPEAAKVRKKAPLAPTDADTQLVTALRQISSRFGHKPPAGIVVFSDGRTRDEVPLEPVVSPFAKLGVPIHVLPTGSLGKRGDISLVAVVIPPRVRKFSEVEVQVFLRSFGFDGHRTEVTITAPARGDQPARTLATLPITLHSGFQAAALSFRTTTESHPVTVGVAAASEEISSDNNAITSGITIDRTKIRVLYIEGSPQGLTQTVVNGRPVIRGPFSDLSQALMTDEDIECVVLSPLGGGTLSRISDAGIERSRGFPETEAELAAFDAIILSDVPERLFTETELEWLTDWVGRRGGGLLMAGGGNSFSSGGWRETKLAELLPVELLDQSDWNSAELIQWLPLLGTGAHPIWSLYTEERRNASALSKIPFITGANRFAAVKPNLTLTLADGRLQGRGNPATPPMPVQNSNSLQDAFRRLIGVESTPGTLPLGQGPERTSAEAGVSASFAIGRYGRGRTAALSTPITPPWSADFNTAWKDGDQNHYPRFWRNVVYWLTESSSIGRRRLIASADKRFYNPGDEIRITASAFNELARQTKDYRLVAMIEPGGNLKDVVSDYSPLKWPAGLPRTSGEEGPDIAWGEELEIPLVETGDAPDYGLTLPIADVLVSGSANQSLRLELTAYEDYTQVDSTSLDLQILHDPFELQNPFPNHDLLKDVARLSGGKVLRDGADLATVLTDVPLKVGPPIISKHPLWSSWWLWGWLIVLLTVEWLWRRKVGLA